MTADVSEQGESVVIELAEEEKRAMRSPKHVQARILWPALGFPAVIAPRETPSDSPLRDGDATRCICVLLLSNRRFLSKAEAARHLRYVPWGERGRRHISEGATGSFAEEELAVRNDENEPGLVLPGASDDFGEIVAFGGDADGANAITVTLAHYVRSFYRKRGLSYLHEIRISERASARLQDGRYHLFWNNADTNEQAPSDEMKLLLNRFARPRRQNLRTLWKRHASYLLSEYEYEYGVLHRPYRSQLAMRRPRTEILHPLFVQRPAKPRVKIAHLTDLHVHVRADAYEENLKQRRFKDVNGKWSTVAFNNWNTSTTKLYERARKDCDLVLMTGDLIDYGRGHWGQRATQRLGEDDLYHVDRNWFLFYYLIASGDTYEKPVYTILGNHDWRLNPYPPFAIAGSPNPKDLIHNHYRFDQKGQERILRTAHGLGAGRKLSYFGRTEKMFITQSAKQGSLFKALGKILTSRRSMDIQHTPVETTVESVAWYLLTINPFLDYTFALPGGHRFLMLDWAEDEDLLFDVVRNGRAFPYLFWQFKTAASGGPRTRRALTRLQQRLVKLFVEADGKAKVLGVHAPPIGPYSDWSDHDLLLGKKRYRDAAKKRGPSTAYLLKSNGRKVPLNGHPLLAVRPKYFPRGMTADYGSIGRKRDWLIKKLRTKGAGVRLVLSGHIHRSGLYVVHDRLTLRYHPGYGHWVHESKRTLAMRGLPPSGVRGARPPAVSLAPEGKQGPLYVNTTSAGPRGSAVPQAGDKKSVAPGYAEIELARDGTIHSVTFRSLVTRRKTGARQRGSMVQRTPSDVLGQTQASASNQA